MEITDSTLRNLIIEAVSKGLQSMPEVLAGWVCGSVAFNLEDEYSDIDLNFLVDDACSADSIYTVVESTLETVSPVKTTHSDPPGRYFKLKDGGDFLLVDVCIYHTGDLVERLDKTRHGNIIPLFDKGEWFRQESSAEPKRTAAIANRLKEHQAWFSVSQSFVQKAIFRDRQVEALAAYWGYTLKPLVELLRITYCPHRWDFGMRYLEQDLPGAVYNELCSLMYVGESDELAEYLSKATSWAERLLRGLENVTDSAPKVG